jgi:1-deoxy-D-xylulose-5-phosphate reductoisomerase
MVRLKDGAVYAQLSRPDMRLPLHEALYFPNCTPSCLGGLNFDSLTLEFEKPCFEKFPMLSLAYQAIRAGGLYPAAYNASNEAAVSAFLGQKAGFLDIPRIVDYVLKKDWCINSLSLASILEADRRARNLAAAYLEGL